MHWLLKPSVIDDSLLLPFCLIRVTVNGDIVQCFYASKGTIVDSSESTYHHLRSIVFIINVKFASVINNTNFGFTNIHRGV